MQQLRWILRNPSVWPRPHALSQEYKASVLSAHALPGQPLALEQHYPCNTNIVAALPSVRHRKNLQLLPPRWKLEAEASASFSGLRRPDPSACSSAQNDNRKRVRTRLRVQKRAFYALPRDPTREQPNRDTCAWPFTSLGKRALRRKNTQQLDVCCVSLRTPPGRWVRRVHDEGHHTLHTRSLVLPILARAECYCHHISQRDTGRGVKR